MSIDIVPTGQACGAVVRGVDLTQPLTTSEIADIRAAWIHHLLLVFPDQPTTDDDLVRFAHYFGPSGEDTFFRPVDGHPEIAAIRRLANETSPLFAENWHTDWSFQEFPPDGTCLTARVVPPQGGDTWFANQQMALAQMPADLRHRLEGLTAIHSARGGYAPDGAYGADDEGERSMDIVFNESAYDTQTHPLISPHRESGVESIYSTLGYIIGFEGMVDHEALPLLRELAAWQTREEFQYRHRWQPNMLVLWDNRSLLHRATGGFDGYDRVLHRTTIGYNHDVGRQPAVA